LVHTVLKSNQIAQHVIQDGKTKANGGRRKVSRDTDVISRVVAAVKKLSIRVGVARERLTL